MLHHANKIKFISHGDYCPSLVSVCDQARFLFASTAAAVIAAVAPALAVADYPAVVYPDIPGDFAAMQAVLVSAYCLADLGLDYHLDDRALKYPAVRVALFQVADAFAPDLPDVVTYRNRDQVLLNVGFLAFYCLAHRACAVALAEKILSARLALCSAA